MEVLNIWLPLIGGGVFTAIAIGAWFAEHRLTGIWFGFAAVVSFALLAALQLHEHEVARKHPAPPVKQADSPDRAWVSLEMEIISPLAYDAAGWDAGTRWHILFKYRLTNTGNTPATNVDFFANMMPFLIGYWPEDRIKDGVPQGEPVPGTNAAAELKRLCESAAILRQAGNMMGKTLFKGQSVEGRFRINGNPALFDAVRQSRGYSGNILLLACATYNTTTDDRMHQTGESFAIFRPDAKISLENGTVPQSELRMTPQPMGGTFAN